MTKNVHSKKCYCSGNDIGCNSKSIASILNFWVKMLLFLVKIIVHQHMQSAHADKRKIDILVLGEEPPQELNDTTSTVETNYFMNITRSKKKF